MREGVGGDGEGGGGGGGGRRSLIKHLKRHAHVGGRREGGCKGGGLQSAQEGVHTRVMGGKGVVCVKIAGQVGACVEGVGQEGVGQEHGGGGRVELHIRTDIQSNTTFTSPRNGW